MNKAELLFEKIAKDKNRISQQAKDVLTGLGIGATAGAISTAIVQPIDQIVNIRATFGADKAAFKGRADTYKNVIKAIYHGDTGAKALEADKYTKGLKGFKNFYHGLGGKLIKTAPQSAILLGLNALLYKAYKNSKHKNINE